MNAKLSAISSKILELEQELETEFEKELEKKREKFQYSLERGKIASGKALRRF